MIFVIRSLAEVVAFPFLLFLALVARIVPRKTYIGIGPDPIVSHRYHKQALQLAGYSAETFCVTPFFITSDFDVIAAPVSKEGISPSKAKKAIGYARLFLRSLFLYKALYLYFHGGCLAKVSVWLGAVEPFLYRLAGVKVVVFPYGSDVQEMSRSPSLYFKHALAKDYPMARKERGKVERRIDRWTRSASHVVGGCEWVDYMYHWDTLVSVHFPIDVEAWSPRPGSDTLNSRTLNTRRPLRLLHAPNHSEIKGTRHFERAVQELREEGEEIELVIVRGVSNAELREAMREADVVLDQLVVGWYAMFAMEGMALGKPVVCYIRADLERLYLMAGVLEEGELPIVKADPLSVKDVLRDLCRSPEKIAKLGEQGRAFVKNRHSIEAMAPVFEKINRAVGLGPGRKVVEVPRENE